VLEKERAGSIRALRVAGLEAALAKESRLLVGPRYRDRDSVGRKPRPRVSPNAKALGQNARQQRARNLKITAKLIAQSAFSRSTSNVRDALLGVSGMDLAAGEIPEKPGVDRPECELACFGAAAKVRMFSSSQRIFVAEK